MTKTRRGTSGEEGTLPVAPQWRIPVGAVFPLLFRVCDVRSCAFVAGACGKKLGSTATFSDVAQICPRKHIIKNVTLASFEAREHTYQT